MKTKLIVIAASIVMLVFTSCTENQRARGLGGTMTVDLPANTKVIGATWKESQLWYLTRPSRPGETPETVTLNESSSYGLLQGKVIFNEK